MLKLILICACLGFVGCAQLSPQRITFVPDLSQVSVPNLGGTASMVVIDDRVNRIIGYRGGIYSNTATIESAQPMANVINGIALDLLTQANVQMTNTFAEAEVRITLNELSFKTEKTKPTIKRSTAVASLAMQVTKNNATFTSGFVSSQYQDTLGYPNDAKNAQLINDVFENALLKLFTDPAFETFWQKH